MKTLSINSIASGPLTLTIDIAPVPAGVAKAIIVSSLNMFYIQKNKIIRTQKYR